MYSLVLYAVLIFVLSVMYEDNSDDDGDAHSWGKEKQGFNLILFNTPRGIQ